MVFRQEIEIQNVKINREHILVFFKKKNSFNFNNFLDEKINFDSVFELLLKERTKDYEALKGFLQAIDNPPNSVIEEVRRFSFATREIETLKNHKNEFEMKISEVLYKNPSLLDVLIFSITYLCISSVLILNHKKIKKNLFPKQ